jgi:hypothetical protein
MHGQKIRHITAAVQVNDRFLRRSFGFGLQNPEFPVLERGVVQLVFEFEMKHGRDGLLWSHLLSQDFFKQQVNPRFLGEVNHEVGCQARLFGFDEMQGATIGGADWFFWGL